MDKYEYKVRAEEIRQLIGQGDFTQAAGIADTIDWRKVKSIMMLCMISDLYKINRRYEDARDLLLLAYERRPGGRNICFSLCELCIKTGEFVQATEYYKEFVREAPRDPGRYILQYKLYEDQDVSLEERIAVLEELKKHDYREKWAYELAYLYHRVGLASRCVEECDELILWFGEGNYVIKAMELKMCHQPLSAEQQEKYDHRFDVPQDDYDDNTDYDDYNLYDDYRENNDYGNNHEYKNNNDNNVVSGDTRPYGKVLFKDIVEKIEDENDFSQNVLDEQKSDELDIQVKTMDVGQYNTINLQAELAQELRGYLNDEKASANTEERNISDGEEITGSAEAHVESEEITESVETYAGKEETAEQYTDAEETTEQFTNAKEAIESAESDTNAKETIKSAESYADAKETTKTSELHTDVKESTDVQDKVNPATEAISSTGRIVMEQMWREEAAKHSIAGVEPPKELANVLSQEPDGQISLVVPEKDNVEKQITGQLNIGDVLAEWERMKKENEEKRKEDVRQLVLQHTGRMFTDFDAAIKDGLLEQLEKDDDIDKTKSVESTEKTITESESTETYEENEAIAEAAESAEAYEENEAIAESAESAEAYEEDDAIAETAESAEAYEENDAIAETAESAEAYEENDAIAEAAESAETYEEDDAIAETAESTETPVQNDEATKSSVKLRSMTREERELYGPYIQSRSTKEQIIRAVDNISLAAYTGNVIITGETGMETLSLAKNMIRELKATDSNFSGKVAKISGNGLNKKNVEDTLNQFQNGALIIQNACGMNKDTAQDLYKALQKESLGIVVLIQDDTKVMNKFLQENEMMLDVFTSRVDVEALSNDMLVAYGKRYAKEQEYSIDELGVLALHNRIEERQTLDHAVTTSEVKSIVDGAIRRANGKTPKHFFDILLAKRYDEEDMIIVTEKDFV